MTLTQPGHNSGSRKGTGWRKLLAKARDARFGEWVWPRMALVGWTRTSDTPGH